MISFEQVIKQKKFVRSLVLSFNLAFTLNAFCLDNIIDEELSKTSSTTHLSPRWQEFHKLEAQALQGSFDAQAKLGTLLLFGNKVIDANPDSAIYWLKKAANSGHAEAQFQLAMAIDSGIGLDVDYVTANAWYQKAANQGHSGAQYNLANSYLEGSGIKKDLQKAYQLFLAVAKKNDSDAQYIVGKMNEQGIGRPVNRQLAIDWYQKAADNDNFQAHYQIAQILKDKEKSHREGINFHLHSAAILGYSRAQLDFSERLAFGLAKDPKNKSAEYWLNQALLQKDENAFLLMADKHLKGDSVEKSLSKAIFYLKEAIDYGSANAEYKFANLVENNVIKGYSTAQFIQHYENAANSGSAPAAKRMCELFLNGVFTKANKEEAVAWCQYAKQLGAEGVLSLLAQAKKLPQ